MPARTQPSPLVGGVSLRPVVLEDYVYSAGLHKPEHSNILSFKYPQYYMTALLDRLGASEGIAQGTWSWDEMDRTRLGGTITSSSISTTSVTFEVTEWDFVATTNPGYVVVGDLLRTEGGGLGRVTAVVISIVLSDKAKVTMYHVGGTDWTAATITNDDKIGHVSSSFPENSSAPDGRLYLPVELSNVLTIIRRSFAISGTEFR